jgi:hypothetical protein
MATLPDHIRTSIAQRQRQRLRCAQTIALQLGDPRLATTATHLLEKGLALLSEDKADLNGTPGVRAAIVVETESWEVLRRLSLRPCTSDELRRVHEQIETIKRTIEVQGTLIELAVPAEATNATPSLQVLWDEYQQRQPPEQ